MMLGMDKSATELAALMREQDAFDRGVKARTSQLRDQFAMAALTALGQAFCEEWRNPSDVQIKWMAEGAYKIADAMLAARGGK